MKTVTEAALGAAVSIPDALTPLPGDRVIAVSGDA